jgi:tight adherence protein B
VSASGTAIAAGLLAGVAIRCGAVTVERSTRRLPAGVPPPAARPTSQPTRRWGRRLYRRVEALAGRVRSRRSFAASLPELVEALARELRAGAPIRVALVDAAEATGGPIRRDAVALRRRLDAGQSPDEVLRWWAAHRRAPELDTVGAAVATGRRLGSEFATGLDALAATMSDRRSIAAEARAQASQAHASALLLVAAPMVFCVVMSAIDPTSTRFLLGSPLGWATLSVSVALDLVGAWWMYRLTERVR